MDYTPTISEFHRRVLRCEGATTEQVAWHEGGHRFFWLATGLAKKARYICRADGYPGVEPVPSRSYDLRKMSQEDAAKLLYIKLGGIAAELIYLGLASAAGEIAAWVADDWLRPQIVDWDDDERNGGDIPQACTIIEWMSNLESVPSNLCRFLPATVEIINNNLSDFRREADDACRLFQRWALEGKWRL